MSGIGDNGNTFTIDIRDDPGRQIRIVGRCDECRADYALLLKPTRRCQLHNTDAPAEKTRLGSCWPLFHRWCQWQTIEEREGAFHGNDPISGDPRLVGGRVAYQRRVCQRCGRIGLRREHAT